jgi:G3E family GTPase
VVSKTDKISDEKILDAATLIKQINGEALIVTTPVELLDGVKLLKTFENIRNFRESFMNDNHHCCCGHGHHEHHEHDCGCHHDHDHHDHECCGHHDHEHHHHHHAEEVFTSWGEESPKAFSKAELDKILSTLCDENANLGLVLRAKGIVRASDNEKWYYFDLVSGEYEIRLGEPEIIGKVCVIGSKLDEKKVNELFFG